MNYHEILKKGENFLKKNKIKNPYLDVDLILSKVTNKKREEILLSLIIFLLFFCLLLLIKLNLHQDMGF